jgi:hypothetical protein
MPNPGPLCFVLCSESGQSKLSNILAFELWQTDACFRATGNWFGTTVMGAKQTSER